ncbi:MAG: hydrogen gas-evolving membrane-bound hydrogenase subunit E [Planctomycetota bacterium]
MAPVWTVFIAVLAPVTLGLLSLFLPRPWIERRMVVAGLGPAVAFVLLLATAIDATSALSDAHQAAKHDHATHSSTHDAGDHTATAASHDDGLTTGTLDWMPTLHINIAFRTDGLGLFFALLVSGIGVMVYLYARGYFGRAGPTSADDLFRFYPTIGFFTTAMLGVVLADYTLLTLLFWEMTSISSFLLIGWDRYDKKAVKLAMQAFFTTGLGGMGLFGGILVFGNTTAALGIGPMGLDPVTGEVVCMGIWRWSEMVAYQSEIIGAITAMSPGLMWAFVLMFIGAGTKSAQFPFHYWLPGAMAAPTPVSAFLHSATMVKAGVFLVGRLFPVFAALPLFPQVIVPLGAVTMFYGAAVALRQHDLKRIFAYTTVSQLGLLMTMYGLGALQYTYKDHVFAAIDFDVTQIANHAFYKAPLFIAAGAIGHVLSRDLTQLNGAFYKHKAICGTMMAAALGLAALPGTISFQAKELFLYGIYHVAKDHPWLWLIMGMTVVTAIFNVAICVRVWTTLLGLPGGLTEADGEHHDDHHHEHAHEHGVLANLIWLPGAVIVSLQFLGGIITPLWNKVFGLFEQPATAVNYFQYKADGVPSLLYAVTHPGIPLLMSGIAIGGGILLGLSKLWRDAITDVCDRIYPALYWLAVTGGGRCFRLVQTGNLKHYLLFVLAFLMGGFIWAAATDSGMAHVLHGDEVGRVLEYWPGALIGLIVCATAVLIPLTESRIVRVLFLGACGFAVVGLYLVYQAPDLALTQLMFEIISVILFVIVLRLLPKEKVAPNIGKWWRIPVAASVGLLFGWMTLIAATTDRTETNPGREPLGVTLAQHSYQIKEDEFGQPKIETAMTDDLGSRGGKGNNVVNVILVDFRGFDTLGEIAVLGLAAMGVWSMIPHRSRRKDALTARGYPKGGAA